MGTSIELHLTRENVQESQTQHPSPVYPEKLLCRCAKEMKEKVRSSTVCKHPIWNHPHVYQPWGGTWILMHS